MNAGAGKSMSLALVHDYLTQRGGAERVALAIADSLSVDAIYSTFYSPSATHDGFGAHNIRTSRLNSIPFFRKDPRRALALLPKAIDSFRITDVDAIVCSSSGWAHGVKTDLPKVVYFHTPARWLYEPADYLQNQPLPVAWGLASCKGMLERWDKASLSNKTTYVANSTVVKNRIKRVYGVESTVIHPPIGIKRGDTEALSHIPPGYWLTVARGRGYKNTDRIIAAAKEINRPLVVVGGTQATQDGTIHHTGIVSDAQLRWLYMNAVGLIAMSHEDFGLTPVEANYFGTPVLALRAGGYLDTISEGVNGLFVESLSPALIIDGMRRLEGETWDRAIICNHAELFSTEAFSDRLLAVVRETIR